MIDAAIFDMDGLLLDTEAQSAYCWAKAGREMGYTITPEMIHSITGSNYAGCQEKMMGYLGGDLDFAWLYDRSCDLIYERMLELNMPLRPWAREILTKLRDAGVKLALATSTNRDRAETELKEAGIFAFFDTLVFGNQVEHGKPAPDIFLLAARKLNAAPENCAVLEDSPNGVAAGKAAGMYTLWVPDQITPSDQPDTADLADAVLPTLREAWELLSR
jgi:HAD superfamily hydrolase (TIGR01509 family)